MDFVFQSTLPARGATRHQGAVWIGITFQSTLPARGATSSVCARTRRLTISIHAPRTGSDNQEGFARKVPREFQSTLPARGATQQIGCITQFTGISIHAPRTGSDATLEITTKPIFHFNPRSPHGERQSNTPTQRRRKVISIHAPRTGSDRQRRRNDGGKQGFQSTLPARGATRLYIRDVLDYIFQSTLPARGATRRKRDVHGDAEISIHAPRTGSDGDTGGSEKGFAHFNPRSPHGERLDPTATRRLDKDISIHAPRTGSDLINEVATYISVISIHAPRTGSDGTTSTKHTVHIFQSTLPARGATSAAMADISAIRISIHAPRTGSDVYVRRLLMAA